MRISIKATNLDLTPSIKSYIEKKIGSVSKFIREFEETGQAQIWLEVSRTTKHHSKGAVFRAEADLRLPKKILRVEHSDIDIYSAVDALKEKLASRISKYKTAVLKRN